MKSRIAPLLAVLALSACSATSTPAPIVSLAPDVSVECGPIADLALCRLAIEVAATAKINPPPIVAAWIRRSDPSDACTEWLQACGPDAVIVVIQSGDTLQNVPLLRSPAGWVVLVSDNA